jgi:hypothetical protein
MSAFSNAYHVNGGEDVDPIDRVALRRDTGNVLVVPPVRNISRCEVFELAVLDGQGGYFYPSDRNEPAEHLVVAGGTHTHTTTAKAWRDRSNPGR